PGSSPARTASSVVSSLANTFGIAPIVLVALHVRLNIGGRHHPNLVPKLGQHARPMMRTPTRLHPHHTAWQLGKKLLHRPTSKLTPNHHFSRRFNSVNLEHVLRQIQTNHANLRHGRSPLLARINTTSLAPMMPSGAVHPIIPGRRASGEPGIPTILPLGTAWI